MPNIQTIQTTYTATLKNAFNKVAFICEANEGMFSLALFIIGCIAVSNPMSGVVMGGVTIGLSFPLLIGTLGKRSSFLTSLKSIMHIAAIVLGALAISGTISAATVGCCLIAPSCAIAFVTFAAICGTLFFGTIGLGLFGYYSSEDS